MTILTKQQLLDTIKLTTSEIMDFNNDHADEVKCELGSVQINVEFKFNNKTFFAQLQTSSTLDYGYVSSCLSTCDCDDMSDEISEYCESNFEGIFHGFEIIDFLIKKFKLQQIFNDYIEENYEHEKGMPFNAMDANSETNEMTRTS